MNADIITLEVEKSGQAQPMNKTKFSRRFERSHVSGAGSDEERKVGGGACAVQSTCRRCDHRCHAMTQPEHNDVITSSTCIRVGSVRYEKFN